MNKVRYVKGISFLKGYVFDLIGINSGILPGNKLRLSYSDSYNSVFNIEESSHNITENPATGKIDVTIKLTLEREAKE